MRRVKLAWPRPARHNHYMYASVAPRIVVPAQRTARSSAVAALFVNECERDMPGVALPRPEVQLVVRFGTMTRRGLDAHAMGGRESVHRKLLPGGLRVVTARLQLGTAEAVLGVPASAIAGRIVTLEDLWGQAPTQRLFARLAHSRTPAEASTELESAISERFASSRVDGARTRLVLAAADQLARGDARSGVSAVASELGVSERHLRRLFRESTGVSPKAFAKLTRFRRALHAAREHSEPSWANIAAAAGYYDQAHLIGEFRTIAGVTPRALLLELRAAHAFG